MLSVLLTQARLCLIRDQLVNILENVILFSNIVSCNCNVSMSNRFNAVII